MANLKKMKTDEGRGEGREKGGMERERDRDRERQRGRERGGRGMREINQGDRPPPPLAFLISTNKCFLLQYFV